MLLNHQSRSEISSVSKLSSKIARSAYAVAKPLSPRSTNSKAVLKSIRGELNGWKVYCAFRNNMGTTNTASATITVTGGNATTSPAPTQTTQRQGFEGRWAGENNARCVLVMTYKSDGVQDVDITWSGGAALKSRWTMTATVTIKDIMEYTDGHYWVQEFINDTEYNVKDEEYNLTGRFFLQDGKLHWVNDRTGEETILIPA